MNISRYIRTKAAGLLTLSAILGGLGASLMLPGCAADDFDGLRDKTEYSSDTQLLITLAIPQGEQIPATLTRAEESAPETDELKINSLRLIIFKESGQAAVNRPLLIPSEMPVNPNKSVIYEVNGLTAGEKYRMYIVANMGEAVTFDGDTDFTESNLKEVMIDCTSQWPTPGNLPMIYEGEELITAPEIGQGPLKKTLSLKYACVKVRMNLIFDKDYERTGINYGEQGFVPVSMTFSHASTKAPLLINAAGQKDLIEGDKGGALTLAGSFYDSWTETPGGTSDTKEIITVTGAGSEKPASYSGKWLSRHTIYLPERYAESEDDQLTFTLEGKLADKNGSQLESTKLNFEDLKVGVADEGVKATDLPRGSFYEIVARVTSKELEGNPMEATVSRLEWDEITLPVDFLHTYLHISKTELNVKSLDEDYLVYETDGSGGIRFECDDDAASTVDGKAAVVGVPMYSVERGQHLEFRVNPSIDITKVTLDENGELNGRATGYIIAGNIKKRVTVNYNMTPFFEITPAERTISWVEGGENMAIFHYRTNLNGVVLTQEDDHTSILFSKQMPSATLGLLSIDMQEDGNPGDSEGYIVMVSSQPESTTVYNMFARPASIPVGKAAEDFGSDISVTVQPQLTAYRIYFRAINDYQEPDTKHSMVDMYIGNTQVDAGYLTEFLLNNGYKLPNEATEKWVDWWSDGYNNNANPDKHSIYIYNQVGNNTDFATASDNVCYFMKWDDYKLMTADNQNSGWYYYDLSKSEKGTWNGSADISDYDRDYYSIPRPNETLIIFHNHGDNATMHHRLAHAKEPGVALGAFADGEGWTLFDPTKDPRYTTYDNKPVIEDVAYTVYSDKPLQEWYTIYGARHDKREEKFRMYANRWLPAGASNEEVTVDGKTYVQNKRVTVDGKTYYKNVLWFKSVRDEYEKCITLRFESDGMRVSNHKVWFEYNFSDNEWPDGSEAVAHFIDSSGKTRSVAMNWNADVTSNNNKIGLRYVVNVPEGFHNSQVYFTNNKDSRYPSGNGTCEIKESHNYIYWQNSNSFGEWNYNEAPDQPIYEQAHIETTLFDGESYTPTGSGTNNRVIEGYFNSATGKWSKNPF